MRPKACQKCGSSKQVRKVTLKEAQWCKKCRDADKPVITSLAEAEEWYEGDRKRLKVRKTLPDFDTMLAWFSNDCESFADLATEFSSSKELIRQIYKKYFSKIIPRRPDGLTRKKVCTIKRRVVRVKDSFFSDERFVLLLAKVAEVGVDAKPVGSVRYPSKHNQQKFFLNNLPCKLLVRSVTNKINKRLYFVFHARNLEGIDFLLLQAGEVDPKFFVLPANKVRQRCMILIPTNFQRPDSGYGRKPKIDWMQFLEAWHFIKPSKPDPVA